MMDFTGPTWSADVGGLRSVAAAGDIREEASARNGGSEPQLALSGSPLWCTCAGQTTHYDEHTDCDFGCTEEFVLTSKAFLLCFWTVDSIGLKS